MIKFSKIIDVKGIEGISQILIYVHQNEKGNCFCSFFTHQPICEGVLNFDLQQRNNNSSVQVFNNISSVPNSELAKIIMESNFYQQFISNNGALNMTNQVIPEGYWKNQQGHLIPLETIKPIDKTRDELVRLLIEKAEQQHEALKVFKDLCFSEIAAFVDQSLTEYGAKLGGTKGNVTLYSYDGSIKIQMAIHENIRVDERLQAAKTLVDECINEWAQGARPEIVAIIKGAFQVDQQGNINTGRILALRRLDIDDERWLKAMQAIADSIQVIGSKAYVRFYKRVGDSDQYKPLSLDIASI